jgi:hypothetical protein
MTICKIEEQYTGGGCEHLSVYFPEYNLEFTIMNAEEKSFDHLPTEGEKWCFNLSNGGTWIDGDYIETSATQHDFKRDTIQSWCEGYIIAKGYQKNDPKPERYTIHDLHESVNDIYFQLDDGHINHKEATLILRSCCHQFLADNQGEAL